MENGGFRESKQRKSGSGEEEGERFVGSNMYFFSIIQMSSLHLFLKMQRQI